jgi:multidrug efflux pump subunit AcrB
MGNKITRKFVLKNQSTIAVVTATTHRFRPVILTAAAAILGMIPIAPTVFWGPMAYAIMGGLAVATVLTLVFLPALYCMWFKVTE